MIPSSIRKLISLLFVPLLVLSGCSRPVPTDTAPVLSDDFYISYEVKEDSTSLKKDYVMSEISLNGTVWLELGDSDEQYVFEKKDNGQYAMYKKDKGSKSFVMSDESVGIDTLNYFESRIAECYNMQKDAGQLDDKGKTDVDGRQCLHYYSEEHSGDYAVYWNLFLDPENNICIAGSYKKKPLFGISGDTKMIQLITYSTDNLSIPVYR
jgi:hypothetical protein